MRSLWAIVIAVVFGSWANAESPRRNVVLMIADDLGQTLGCYGDPTIKSPHIDALAKSGTRFTHAFACVASCSPSRATLFTGMHTHQNGQYGLAHATHNVHTRTPVQSVSKLLKQAGYRTGIVGKLHVLPKEVYPWDVEIPGGKNVPQMARQARQFIEQSGDRPFFLVVGFTDPHRAAKGFGNDQPVPNTPHERYDPKSLKLPYHLPDTDAVRADYADYATSVTRLDHGVGLVMKELADLKRLDDTLVIFLSDNGIPFPGAKTTLYDSGLNLPLIIKAPQKKPTTCEALVSWIDIAPTVLGWTGVTQPTAMQGRSLLPILEEEKPFGWDFVFGSHQFHEITMYYPMRMIRTRTHKYILNLANQLPFPFASDLHDSDTWQDILKRGDSMMGQRTVRQFVNRPREELYDLRNDPNELKNLVGEGDYAKHVADFRKRIRDWQEKTGDPWLIKYQHE